LLNLVRAGPGLGEKAPRGGPKALLDKVAGVLPLRATGLNLLVGETVCAVVFESDVSVNYGPLRANLTGKNLGIAAFQVEGVAAAEDLSSSTLPFVTVRVVDPATACGGALLLLGAPEPLSSSDPMDVTP
jgi:hypothetical protein